MEGAHTARATEHTVTEEGNQWRMVAMGELDRLLKFGIIFAVFFFFGGPIATGLMFVLISIFA